MDRSLKNSCGFFLILLLKIVRGRWLVSALIAISALHGPFGQVRVGQIAALSRLPGERGPPVMFSTRGIKMAGLSLLERVKSSVLVSSLQSKLSHVLIQLQKLISVFSEKKTI